MTYPRVAMVVTAGALVFFAAFSTLVAASDYYSGGFHESMLYHLGAAVVLLVNYLVPLVVCSFVQTSVVWILAARLGIANLRWAFVTTSPAVPATAVLLRLPGWQLLTHHIAVALAALVCQACLLFVIARGRPTTPGSEVDIA